MFFLKCYLNKDDNLLPLLTRCSFFFVRVSLNISFFHFIIFWWFRYLSRQDSSFSHQLFLTCKEEEETHREWNQKENVHVHYSTLLWILFLFFSIDLMIFCSVFLFTLHWNFTLFSYFLFIFLSLRSALLANSIFVSNQEKKMHCRIIRTSIFDNNNNIYWKRENALLCSFFYAALLLPQCVNLTRINTWFCVPWRCVCVLLSSSLLLLLSVFFSLVRLLCGATIRESGIHFQVYITPIYAPHHSRWPHWKRCNA